MEALEKTFANNYGPNFKVWLDRQQRPTLGASVHRGVGTSRPQVGSHTFTWMLKSLTNACKTLIPQHMGDVYLTYSMGSWQRSREFHLKAHLTTTAFLSLTDNLRRRHDLRDNPLHRLRGELERRERTDHHGEKCHELLQNDDRKDLFVEGNIHVAIVNSLNYPLPCIYQTDDAGKPTSSFTVEQLPDALGVLEKFLSKTWGQRGYMVGMILSPDSIIEGSATESYQVAAVVDEKEFARLTGKDEVAVKESWGWVEQRRKYH